MITYSYIYESKAGSSLNSHSSSGQVEHLTNILKKILTKVIGYEGISVKIVCDLESTQECHDYFDKLDYAGLAVEYSA